MPCDMPNSNEFKFEMSKIIPVRKMTYSLTHSDKLLINRNIGTARVTNNKKK